MADVKYMVRAGRRISPLLSSRCLEQIFSSLYEDARHTVYFCLRVFRSVTTNDIVGSTSASSRASADEPRLTFRHDKRLFC